MDAKFFAINSSFESSGLLFGLLLLLLLLLTVDHAALGKLDRLTQHIDLADMVGEDQHQRRIEIGALLLGEPAMRASTMARKASSGRAKLELVDNGMRNLN
ncbi:hypothetical protein ABH981_001485 [Bradyrhizobium ottawaense]